MDDLGPVSRTTLDLWSDRIATALDDGDEAPEKVPGDPHAVLLMPNSAAWLAGYLGALKSGAVVIPLNAALTKAEITRVVTSTRPRHLLTTPERADEMASLCEELRLRTRVHALDSAAPDDLPSTAADRGPRRPVAPARDPRDPCLIMHTSGSTGACKGVVQSERSLHLATGVWHRRHRLPEDVVAVPLPMAHTYGHLAAVSTLLAGATLVVSASCGPEQWARSLRSHGVTVLEAVPTLYARLLRTTPFQQHGTPALPQLRRCLSAGQDAPRALRSQWRQRTGLALLQSWGMTELSGAGLCAAEDLPQCPDSVGLPLPGLEVKVVSPTELHGRKGELWVRGPQVTAGYRNDSGQILPAVDGEGWLHTGDLATLDAHGCVRIVGRSKDAIMTGGYTVQPGEVEEALRRHSAVRDVAVLGRPDPDRGEVPHALVVLDSPEAPSSKAPSSEELIEYCRTMLARYKVPRAIDFVSRLPLSPVGKLDRVALRREFAGSAERAG